MLICELLLGFVAVVIIVLSIIRLYVIYVHIDLPFLVLSSGLGLKF